MSDFSILFKRTPIVRGDLIGYENIAKSSKAARDQEKYYMCAD